MSEHIPGITVGLFPWMVEPITCASKIGFLNKRFWNRILASGERSWRSEQWIMLVREKLMVPTRRFSELDPFLLLTDKGKRAARERGLSPVPAPYGMFLPHDECVLEFGLKLQRSGIVRDWETESELKNKSLIGHSGGMRFDRRNKFPDLLISLSVPGKPVKVAVEVELTVKSKERYREFVLKYKSMDGVDSIIVLANHEGVMNGIKSAQKLLNYPVKTRPMLFGSVKDVVANPVDGLLDFDGERVSISQLVSRISSNRRTA